MATQAKNLTVIVVEPSSDGFTHIFAHNKDENTKENVQISFTTKDKDILNDLQPGTQISLSLSVSSPAPQSESAINARVEKAGTPDSGGLSPAPKTVLPEQKAATEKTE